MKIGERMKAARQQARLTQQQVADAIQSTKASVSQYENDYYHPSLETLVRFSELTGASLDWLILGRETSMGYDRRIRDLPEALKEYVIEALLLAYNHPHQPSFCARQPQRPTLNSLSTCRNWQKLMKSL